jgi:hypothetical protein
LIRAYRQVGGEIETELLKNGFVIADQLRQEQAIRNPDQQPGTITAADQLEAFLVSEAARDSYETAIRFVHSMEDGTPKLMSLVQIAQALSQSNY